MNDHAQAPRLTLDGTSIGDEAVDVVFPRLYEELRRLAASALRRERAGHTLQPTALVHEAFLRLANSADVPWDSHDHFVAIAGRVMRQVLVDHARRKHAAKRSTGAVRVSLDDVDVPAATVDVDLVALDAALVKLGTFDERQARIVELRFFGGLSVPETAALIGASERTVKRDWQIARAWLTRELSHGNTA